MNFGQREEGQARFASSAGGPTYGPSVDWKRLWLAQGVWGTEIQMAYVGESSARAEHKALILIVVSRGRLVVQVPRVQT